MVTDNAPETIAMFDIEIDPEYTYEKCLNDWRNTDCKIKIMKDLNIAVHDEDIPEIISEDSINIFLVRHPALAATSYLPNAEITYFEIIDSSQAFDFTETFQKMLEGIKYAEKTCKKPPLVLSGDVLSSKEQSVKAVKKICELIEVEFSEDMLTWESREGFDPTWDVAYLANESNNPIGFFSRANQSTGFEDAKEREIDMKQIEDDNEAMAERIKSCEPVYEEILKYAAKF